MVLMPKKKVSQKDKTDKTETDNISVVTSKSKISKTYDFLENLENRLQMQ